MKENRHEYVLTPAGEVAVRSKGSGTILWRGLPGGRRARSVVMLHDRCVVLAEPDLATKNDENLMCIDDLGNVLWRAPLPDRSGLDRYVSVSLEDGALVANSWSGFHVVLDVTSGGILKATFVK